MSLSKPMKNCAGPSQKSQKMDLAIPPLQSPNSSTNEATEEIDYEETPWHMLHYDIKQDIIKFVPLKSVHLVNREFHDLAQSRTRFLVSFEKLPLCRETRRHQLNAMILRKPHVLSVNMQYLWSEYESIFPRLAEQVRVLTFFTNCDCFSNNNVDYYASIYENTKPNPHVLACILKKIKFLEKFYWLGIHTYVVKHTAPFEDGELPKFENLIELRVECACKWVLPIFYKAKKLKWLSMIDEVHDVILTNNTELLEFKVKFTSFWIIPESMFLKTFPSVKRLVVSSYFSFEQKMMRMVERFTWITAFHLKLINASLNVDLSGLKELRHLVDVRLSLGNCYDIKDHIININVGSQLISLELDQKIGFFIEITDFIRDVAELAKKNDKIRFLRLNGFITNEIISAVLNNFLHLEHLDLRLCEREIMFDKGSMDMLFGSNLKRFSVIKVPLSFEEQIMDRFYSDGDCKKDWLKIVRGKDAMHRPSIEIVYHNGDFLSEE